MRNEFYHSIFRYISEHYPDVRYSSDMISFLLAMFGGNKVFRAINYILDHNREQIIYIEGANHLNYIKEEWSYALHRRIVPSGYNLINFQIAMNSYKLFFKHRLSKRTIISQKAILLQNANGEYETATHVVSVLLADEQSRPILTAGTFLLHDSWDPAIDPPLVIRPTLWQKEEKRLPELELELFQLTYTYEFMTRSLKINPAWMPVLIGHMKHFNNAQISAHLNLPPTKVNYYNLKLMQSFKELFLTDFINAEACAQFLLRMGVRPEWIQYKPDGTSIW